VALYELTDKEATALTEALKTYVDVVAPVGGFKSLPTEKQRMILSLERVLDELYNVSHGD